jgi:leader peptidase (prepilin peptidase) / N-methyltransferase
MTALSIAVAGAFALLGAAAERLAAVWPADEASRRRPGPRTVLLAIVAGAAGWGIVARSTLPWWATAVHLAVLALLVLLTATDLEQRRLPHLLLDPLIVLCVAFVPFNPTVTVLNAIMGGLASLAVLGLLGMVIRGGVAMGDLYLVGALGLLLGWQGIFVAVFIGAVLASIASIGLLLSRRVGMKSYIPFGPFLVAGAVITLLRDEHLLGAALALGGPLLIVSVVLFRLPR